MPTLIQDSSADGVKEVKWTWFPYFLAIDEALHKEIDRRLAEEFVGKAFDEYAINDKIVSLCCELRPHYSGLRDVLQAVLNLRLEDG